MRRPDVRVFCASLQTETNTFSPWRSGDEDFSHQFFAAGALPDRLSLYTSVFAPARRECAANGWTLIEGVCAGAEPGGIVNGATWRRLRDQLLSDLAAAGEIDAVLLNLHGAMVAEGCLDCEGELFRRIRGLVGPACAVGAVLDPHCHLTAAMLGAADVLIAFKEYPHTDSFERAEELWRLVLDTARGRVRPVPTVYDCRMLTMFFTTMEPSAGLVRMMREAEAVPGVLSVSLAHGFPWGDVPEAGAKVLVYTDQDVSRGQAVAERIGRAVVETRGHTTGPFVTPEQAVARARAWAGPGPLVLADTADNVGGGAPGDSTLLLGPLLEAGISEAGAAFVFDPIAVQIAMAAGTGARLPLRVGGKASARSGQPLDLDVEVLLTEREAVHDPGRERLPLGDIAVVRAGSQFDLVLTSVRCQCYHRRAFQQFGIDPRAKRVLLVKSMQHFVGGFQKIAGEILRVDSPGAASLDVHALAYRNLDTGMWPLGKGAPPDRAVSYPRMRA